MLPEGTASTAAGNADARVLTVLFPSAANADRGDTDAATNRHAAAAEDVGEACTAVHMVVAYNFVHGRTVLHRSLGGAKILAFANGALGRWRRHLDGGGGGEDGAEAATRMILVDTTYHRYRVKCMNVVVFVVLCLAFTYIHTM